MKWEELIAEARSAGVLAFCADGIAVLKKADDAAKKENRQSGSDSSVPLAGQDREQGRKSGDRKSQSANDTPG